MCKDDKRHKINVAYNLIEKVCNDTDDDCNAYDDLCNALDWLGAWFDEEDI